MNELESLMEQKKEINRKIQEIKNRGLVQIGQVKLDKQMWGSHERWLVAINCADFRVSGNEHRSWKSIINGTNKKDVVKQIPSIIESLQSLYNQEECDEQ